MTLMQLSDIWDRLKATFKARNLYQGRIGTLNDPYFAAAPLGTLEACSLVDRKGNAALVFDSFQFFAVPIICCEIARMLARTALDIPPAVIDMVSMSEDDIQEGVNTLSIVLNILTRKIRSLLVFTHLLGLTIKKANPAVDSIMKELESGFHVFVVGHELGHFLYGHHDTIAQKIASGAPESEIEEAHFVSEYMADYFGIQCVLNSWASQAESADDRAGDRLGLNLLGMLSFFYFCDSVELIKLSERLRKFNFSVRRSTTHPPARSRLDAAFNILKTLTGADERKNAIVARVKNLFDMATGKAMSRALSMPIDEDDLDETEEVVFNAYHLRSF